MENQPLIYDDERYSQRARRVLRLAQEESGRLQHGYIGTEHLLLGLMKEEGGVAGRVLRNLGLDQSQLLDLVGHRSMAETTGSNALPDLLPDAKKVLDATIDEADSMGHKYIGTEHLLLGLVRNMDGVAIELLKQLNVNPDEVRRQTLRILQASPIQKKPNDSPKL